MKSKEALCQPPNKALQTDTSSCHAPCNGKSRASLPCR